MNTLEKACFFAIRQPHGDVWITHGLNRQMMLIIFKDECRELAEFIYPTESADTKVDYSRCAGEPE